jgi:hypothetical protein
MNERVSYNIRMTKEFDSVLKEICSIERIQNKSLLVRSMCYDFVRRNYGSLLGSDRV